MADFNYPITAESLAEVVQSNEGMSVAEAKDKVMEYLRVGLFDALDGAMSAEQFRQTYSVQFFNDDHVAQANRRRARRARRMEEAGDAGESELFGTIALRAFADSEEEAEAAVRRFGDDWEPVTTNIGGEGGVNPELGSGCPDNMVNPFACECGTATAYDENGCVKTMCKEKVWPDTMNYIQRCN